MHIWEYDADSGALKTLEGRTLRPVPRRESLPEGHPDKYPIVGNATTAPPPESAPGQWPVWDEAAGAWRQAEDHRGETVYLTAERQDKDGKVMGYTGDKVEIDAPGPLPGDVTRAAPGPYDRWDAKAGAWVEDAVLKRAATIPARITPRQMLIGLMTQGIISETEAIDAARIGAVPASIQRAFDALPTPAERAGAAITWAKMSVVEREHSLVAALAEANGMSEADVDAFFLTCAKI